MVKGKRHKISVRKNELPTWVAPVLQGLSYWIGYKHTLYRHHLLSEGAIVGEAYALMQANLHDDEELLSEVSYELLLVPGFVKSKDKSVERADLAIATAGARTDCKNAKNIRNKLRAVIEVKRASATRKLLNDDLRRLGDCKKSAPLKLRTFLLVVGQKYDSNFIMKKDGKAHRGALLVPQSDYTFRIRRLCRALATTTKGRSKKMIRSRKRQHFACLLEVFT